jgi:hypothetical protein
LKENHFKMRRLKIEAASLASARSFHRALSEFGCELEGDATGYFSVYVPIRTDGDILGVLQALAKDVAKRLEGVAPVDVAGRTDPGRLASEIQSWSQTKESSWASE